MAPVQTIPTVNQNGMNIAVSSFVQASQTQKTAQSQTSAKEIEHELLQDEANIKVLKEAGQIDTLTSSAVVNAYNEDEDKKEQAFFLSDDEDEEEKEELAEDAHDQVEYDQEEYDEESAEFLMQAEKELENNTKAFEEASNEPFLGNVLNIKV